MAVSNFYGTNALVTHSPIVGDLQQFGEFEGVKHSDGQNLFAQDDRVTQVRARTFFRFLEQNLKSQEKSKSSLQVLLRQTLQLSDSEGNKQLLGEISQIFFKQSGYFSRLFSGEFWGEWTESRTALGKVASQLRDCVESRARVDSFTQTLDREIIRQANEEAEELLASFDIAIKPLSSKSSCVNGLVGGTLGSLLLQHPLPLFLGLSQCFSGVQAQQKVGSEFLVNNYTLNDQQFPSIASFPNGNFVVTWQSDDQDASSWEVYGQLFNGTGNEIGGEFRVNTYIPGSQDSPSVSSFANGNLVVTWQSLDQDGSGYGIYGQLFNGTGAKIGREFQVNTYTSGSQRFPSVAILKDGNFISIWQSDGQDGSFYGIFGQLFDANGTKIGSEFLVNNYTLNDQQYPSVASLQDGNFVVTWESQDSAQRGVFGQLFDGGGNKIGNEFQVNTYVFDDQRMPAVGCFNNGNIVVTWSSRWQDGDLDGVYGQLFDEQGKKVGTEFQVNSEVVKQQRISDVASLSNDHFIVVWQSGSQDGSSWGVFGQLFDETGIKIGNEFRVNTYMVDDQSQPSVAGLQDGNFVVTWHSNLQDGSGFGIFGQIFHDNITYSSTSSTTSSSTTSTTSSTSSSTTTSSTMSTGSPSAKSSKSSSTSRTSKSSIFRSSSGISHEISSSSSSPSNKRLLWLWLLLGIGSGATCLGSTVIFFLKSRNKEANGDVLTAELGEIEQTNGSTGEGDYQRTPDRVKPEDGRQYGRLSHDSTMEGDYQRTPDRVKPEDGRQYGRLSHDSTMEGDYQRTPDNVKPL